MRKNFGIFFVLLVILLPSSAFSDDLRKVQKSKQFMKATERANYSVRTLYSEKWFRGGNAYGELFLQSQGSLVVYQLLGQSPEMYSASTTATEKLEIGLKITRKYLTPTNRPIETVFFVPHPIASETCRLLLTDACRELTIPPENRLQSTIITLKDGILAEKIQTVDNKCRTVVKLARNSIFTAEEEICGKDSELDNLVAFFDFSKYNSVISQ